MATITVDQATYDALHLAARLTGMTHSQVVARLVQQSKAASDAGPTEVNNDDTVLIFADYEGHRTSARFNRLTTRIDIADGPLSGESFKSPSSAARAVVAHYKPDVNPHRNGWSFWMLADGSGAFLQSIREA
ncbi:MAG: hypothetical protein ACTHNS_09415 [Marmoricola sp.]